MRIDRRDDVQKTTDHNEFRSIIGRSDLDGPMSEIKNTSEDVKRSTAQITGKTKHLQRVPCVGMVQLALHQKTKNEHGCDGSKEQQRTDPVPGNNVPQTGDQPSQNEC